MANLAQKQILILLSLLTMLKMFVKHMKLRSRYTIVIELLLIPVN